MFRDHSGALIIGTIVSLATFALFDPMTVFAFPGEPRRSAIAEKFLVMQLAGIIFFAVAIPIGGLRLNALPAAARFCG